MQKGQRYYNAVYGIQSAIAFLMGMNDRAFVEPKHLRVGIDTSKADMDGLVRLLIEKKVFTEEEYEETMVLANERELERYTKHVRDLTGNDHISFG